MNHEELQNLIKDSIKNEKLRDYLLKYFEYDCKLNINLPPALIEKATQRFKNKIKTFQKIEKALPDGLILPGDYRLLGHKLDTLRLNFAILYANDADGITEDFGNEIKNFISEILSKNIQLKLKYFDLIIKLLEKAETGNAESHSNKEFIGALDLLRKFVNEKEYSPNEADLKYISNLDHGSNESDIRKSFYGIIHELDKKLIFQDLLKQLLEIIENKNDLPLILFSIIFISKCLDDAQMDADDLHQVLHIMHSAFKDYNEQGKKKKLNTILNRIGRHNLIDLNKFEKDLHEKISLSITDNLVNQSSQIQESVQVALILKGLDFGTFFTTDVNNKKIKRKLNEAIIDYNQKFKKEIITTDNSSSKFFRKGWEKISSTADKIITKGKIITADAVVNLGEFAETSANRLTSLVKKNPATSSSQGHEETDQIDLNNSSTQAKEKLSSIKEKLTVWNSILNYPIKPHINQQNQIDTSQIEITKNIEDFEASINKKYTSLNLKILDELEKTNTTIEKENNWFAEPEINKISLAYKIFHRGYFNIEFSKEKLKAKLGDPPSFEKINNFILKQSFWSLLFTYRIVRWPWRKNNLAFTWAEQLSLPSVINQIKELKEKLSKNNNEDLVKKINVLLNAFPSYKENDTVVKLQIEFKEYIVAQLDQLERLEINDCSNEKINLVKTPGPRNRASFLPFFDLYRSATDVSSQYQSPILVN